MHPDRQEKKRPSLLERLLYVQPDSENPLLAKEGDHQQQGAAGQQVLWDRLNFSSPQTTPPTDEERGRRLISVDPKGTKFYVQQ